MLIGSLLLGIVLGLLAGGRIDNLASVRLRLVQALFLGLFLRYATQFAIEAGSAPADALRLPLFTLGFALLLAGLWVNREQPGLPLAFVGILLNAVAMTTNGGYMPVWQPSIIAAGLPITEVGSAFHKIVGAASGGAIPSDFLAQAGPLGDIIPIPIPFLRNVASLGDLFLAAGLAFFLFATTVRAPAELEAAGVAEISRRVTALGERAAPPDATLAGADASVGAIPDAGGAATIAAFSGAGLVDASTLERPLVLGGGTPGSEGVASRVRRLPIPGVPPILARVRRHPYIRLALDSSFSALWTGQLISLVGDRVHQVALAFLVLRATNSAIAVGVVFLVATLPNLMFGPIAGTLVDRWDHREVMIVSDLLRAGVVLLIPIAAVTNIALVYPLVFLVTTISIFFRPAKVAILPRMVAEEDLVTANSAQWVGETFADIGGYPLAGLFVALLGSQLPLAFWVDSVTYVASAVLIASIAVAPISQAVAPRVAELAGGVRGALGRFGAELKEGWRFLRAEPVLLANTLQGAAAQFTLGIVLALTPVFARDAIAGRGFDSAAVYSFLEGAIGAGNLVGGFVIGLIGSRIALGRMVIIGYALTGGLLTALALTGNLPLAIGLAFGVGVGNLAFVIPSQTLFQRRVPTDLMGRVLGFRFSLVFGSMSIAMGVGGVLGEAFGAAPVIGAFGLVTLAAGLAGILVPSVRDA